MSWRENVFKNVKPRIVRAILQLFERDRVASAPLARLGGPSEDVVMAGGEEEGAKASLVGGGEAPPPEDLGRIHEVVESFGTTKVTHVCLCSFENDSEYRDP